MRLRSVAILTAFLAASLAFQGHSAAHDRDHEKGSAAPNPADSTDPTGLAPCIRGMAANTFPCDGIDMLSRLSLDDLGMSMVNDIWGWTDPRTKHDYALVGGIEGTAIVDLTIPIWPRHVGTLPSASDDPTYESWRDIKVVNDHMFVGSEHLNHGLQVFDLTEVRGVKWWDDPVTFEETANYDGFTSSHNLVANDDTGFIYAVGTRDADDNLTCGGGLHMVDVNDPANPTFAGCFEEHGYIHDSQCVVYEGPDTRYQGREICFNSNSPGAYGSADHYVSIADVTDKSNPVALARVPYPQSGYSHQGWLTEDQKFFLHGDEGDEQSHGLGTTTRGWDVTDLENPEQVLTFENGTSIDHNMYTEGDRLYQSNYTSGFKVVDTSGLYDDDPALSQTGFFDVYPENDDATFEGGTWSNYPYFRQKNIVAVSSMDRGLFILRPRGNVR